MKKSLKFSLLALVIAGAVACNKDDDKDDDQPTTGEDLIVGTWNGVSDQWYVYNSETNDTVEYEMDEDFSAIVTFGEDGTVETIDDDDTTTGTYTLDGTALNMITDEDTLDFEVAELTESDLVLEMSMTDSVYVGEQTYTFEKQ